MKTINVFLDLDQTVISSELLDTNQADDGDRIYNIEDNLEKARMFNFQNMEGLYVIFERPHLQPFLTFLFANFNVSVWTAASQDYANFIVKNIVIADHPERKLEYFLCNYHGKKSSCMFSGSKDLKMLWECYKIPGYTKDNTIILDDYDEVWNTQMENCIIAKEFCYFTEDSEEETFLVKLQELLQKQILDSTDLNLPEVIKSINSTMSWYV
jgi:TFIIF-interacting CTD phosphatase-like protein